MLRFADNIDILAERDTYLENNIEWNEQSTKFRIWFKNEQNQC